MSRFCRREFMPSRRLDLLPLGCFLQLSGPVSADPAAWPALTNQAPVVSNFSETNPPPSTVSDIDPVKPIIEAHTCTHIEQSPDKLWVALTRDYARPPRHAIWRNDDAQSCLEILQLNDEGNGFGRSSSYVYWEDPSLDIIDIAWSPDSRFLVLLCTGSNGHQPWAHPAFILDIQNDKLHGMDPFGTVVSSHIKFTDAGELELSSGEPSSPQTFRVDLAKKVADLPVVLQLHEQ